MAKTHGMYGSREWSSWDHMKRRCNNPKDPNYKYYGERGIKVCDRWLQSFENFFKDMGFAPEGCTLDRERVNEGYSPENCRWSTTRIQGNNKRNNLFFTYNGETKNLSDWCSQLGLNHINTYNRIKKGWSFEDAIKIPIGHNRLGSKNNRAIFNQEQRQEIYNLYKSGVIKAEIARKYNSNFSTIHSVINTFL